MLAGRPDRDFHGAGLEVRDDRGEAVRDPLAWVRDCAERALAQASAAQILVIGKSLASLLAEQVADRGFPAAWLTPLLTEAAVTDALAKTRQRTLLIGGTADRLWQPGFPWASRYRPLETYNPAKRRFRRRALDSCTTMCVSQEPSRDGSRSSDRCSTIT